MQKLIDDASAQPAFRSGNAAILNRGGFSFTTMQRAKGWVTRRASFTLRRPTGITRKACVQAIPDRKERMIWIPLR
jgi:hypothetical protein